MRIEIFGDDLPIINVKADPQGEDVNTSELLNAIEPYKSTGVHVQLNGHIRLSTDLQFTGYRNSQFVGVGKAIIEQKNAYNDATPLGLTDCQDVLVSNLKLCGTGTQRPDGNPPQQNGLRITRSRYIHVERCFLGPVTEVGTIKHAISIVDNSHWIWLRNNRMRRTTGVAVIVGSGIWPHPTDIRAFEDHKCTNIRVERNDIEEVGAGVAIDDATAVSWVVGNRIKLNFGHGIVIEDGSIWFEITGNICGPARGAAVVIGHGQSGVWASRGVVTNNMAAGCNDRRIEAPAGFYSVDPSRGAFHRGEGSYLDFQTNIDVPGG